MRTFCVSVFAAVTLVAPSASAPVDARMFRYPDVSATQIAFVYAGDIWTVPKKGGTDTQLARAIQEVLQRIGSLPAAPARPPYEKRVPRGGK